MKLCLGEVFFRYVGVSVSLCSWVLCLLLNHEVICTITFYPSNGYPFLFLNESEELDKISLLPHLAFVEGKLEASMWPLDILNSKLSWAWTSVLGLSRLPKSKRWVWLPSTHIVATHHIILFLIDVQGLQWLGTCHCEVQRGSNGIYSLGLLINYMHLHARLLL